jgi:predicted transcriptional regulator
VEVIQRNAKKRCRGPHRSKYEIINEILKSVFSSKPSVSSDRRRCKPIDIAYDCCLTWLQFQVYRSFLLKLNLLNSIKANGHQSYEITEKGLEYLRVFSELQAEMKSLIDFPSTTSK